MNTVMIRCAVSVLIALVQAGCYAANPQADKKATQNALLARAKPLVEQHSQLLAARKNALAAQNQSGGQAQEVVVLNQQIQKLQIQKQQTARELARLWGFEFKDGICAKPKLP